MTIGCFFFLLGVTLAICILIAGRSIAKRKRYWFAFVVGCVECIFVAFGTVLGAFTVIVLSRESARKLFQQPEFGAPT